METNEIITLGTDLGLNYINENDITKQPSIINGIVVFTGTNGQHFLINSKWSKNKIHLELGKALISYGKSLKSIEIRNMLSHLHD